MTVKELVELMATEDFNLQDKLNIKKYIPVMDKKMMAMDAIAAHTDDFGGFIEVDKFKMDIYFDMCVLSKYTGLEVSFDFDDMIAEYDMLCENNMFYAIVSYFKNDYERCKEILNKELEAFMAQNSFETQVVKVVNRINNLLDEFSDKFAGVNLNEIITDGINLGELMETIKLLK